jgi:hypothetical protein
VIVILYAGLAALGADVTRTGELVHENDTAAILAGAVISAAVTFRVTLRVLHHVTVAAFSTETLYLAARPSATATSRWLREEVSLA